MQTGIIGLGNFGAAIGNLIASNGREVLGWEHHKEVVDEINEGHRNTRYLPGIDLDPRLSATRDLQAILDTCTVVFLALPSAFVRSTLAPFEGRVKEQVLIVNLAKGFDTRTGLTVFQTVRTLFPGQRKVMLSGPSIANEFARGKPTTVVVAGDEMGDLLKVSGLLDNGYFRTRFSDDVTGVEMGGILKNIYAIGLGLFDGKSIDSTNFRSVYLTFAIEETAAFGTAMGARRETFFSLSGIGDLLTTSLSGHSHNRKMGELLARGRSLEEIRQEMGVLPEGYNTLGHVLPIAERLYTQMPVARAIWKIISGEGNPEDFINSFTTGSCA
jgi:glycerol-3-phosphate dehydrogenase (NAD(P)+)